MQDLINFIQDTVRYSDVFGSQSILVEHTPEVSAFFDGYGTTPHIIITVLILVYLYLITRYFLQIKQIFSQIIGERYIKVENKKSRVSLQFTSWYFILLGIFSASLFIPRISMEYYPVKVDSTTIAVYIAGVIILYVLWQLLYCLVIEFITEKSNFTQKVVWYKLKYATGALVLVTPFILYYTITGNSMKWSLYISAIIILIFILVYSVGILNLFQKSNISKFYWILYLCTSDLFPISLMCIPIVKGI